jgi:hypothetical protein
MFITANRNTINEIAKLELICTYGGRESCAQGFGGEN